MLRRADLALKNLDKTRKADKAQVKEARKALKKAMLKKDTDALAQACDEMESLLEALGMNGYE